MAKRNLTDRALKALKSDAMDTVVPGFGVRVSPLGAKTFVLIARYPGSTNPTRRAIGRYGAIDLATARQTARDWLEMIRQGKDPAEEIERQRTTEARQRANTFGAVFEHFAREKLHTERKGAEVERDLRKECLPEWGGRPITEITAEDVRQLVKAIKERAAPYQAHNMLGYIRRLCGWAIDQGEEAYGLKTSPCERLKPKAIIGERKARKRVLSDAEIFAFWRACSRMLYPYGALGQFLLVTGQRHQEGAEIARHELNPAGDLWAIGAERFKSDADHIVPLSAEARAILERLPRFKTGDFLFSTSFGAKPTKISDKIKKAIDERMLRTLKAIARQRGEDPARVELKDWVVHDLRRTLRTHLAALRIPDHIAEMVIGHGRKGVQRVYDQHRYIEEMREALTLWAGRLRSIVQPQSSNVVELAKARA